MSSPTRMWSAGPACNLDVGQKSVQTLRGKAGSNVRIEATRCLLPIGCWTNISWPAGSSSLPPLPDIEERRALADLRPGTGTPARPPSLSIINVSRMTEQFLRTSWRNLMTQRTTVWRGEQTIYCYFFQTNNWQLLDFYNSINHTYVETKSRAHSFW